MLVSFRSRAALAATLFALAACGEDTALPTNLDTAEVTEDVAVTQAAFENQQTESLLDFGFAIDNAIASYGGLPASMASIVAAGPTRPAHPRSAAMLLARAEEYTASEPMSAIPAALLGKTLVWNETTGEYELSEIAGAPASGVRFRLYAIDEQTGELATPLEYIGYADLSREGTQANPAARLRLATAANGTLLEYVATIGGSEQAPSFSIDGTAGIGPNAVTFELNVGVNLINETITAVWETEIPTRGLITRTTLAIGNNNFTLNGLLQSGDSKIELVGTLDFETGGEITVKIGNQTFATMTIDAFGEATEFVNADGDPLTSEQQEALTEVFDWFASTFDWYAGLLQPVQVVLDA